MPRKFFDERGVVHVKRYAGRCCHGHRRHGGICKRCRARVFRVEQTNPRTSRMSGES